MRASPGLPPRPFEASCEHIYKKKWELENATIASIRICDAQGVARVFVRRFIPPFNFQRLSNLFLNLSLSLFSLRKQRSAQTKESTSQRNISTTKTCTSRSAVFGSSRAHRRVATLPLSVQRGGNVEKFMAPNGSIQGSISTCWNFEQLSMWSSGRYGPHQTFIPKGVLAVDSMVILGALAKGRSASRRLAPLVMKFDSLMVAASYPSLPPPPPLSTPFLVYCRTDLNPADGPSRQG